MALLDAGSVAPEFTLPDENGVRRSLAELRKKGPVVV
jgi:peroxiredoxin